MSVTLLTCTGDRQEAIQLLEKYIARQTQMPDEWICIDDGKEPTTFTMNQKVIRLDPVSTPSESFKRNYTVGLGHITTDMVVIAEDDDWYSNFAIEKTVAMLRGKWLAGEANAKYYNVKQRCWKIYNNIRHASLCQTGMNGREIRALALKYLALDPKPETLDGGIWQRSDVAEERKHLCPGSHLAIGIKGMPGRGGIGTFGHKPSEDYTPDPDLAQLRAWIGNDACLYEKFKEESNSDTMGQSV